MDYLAVDSGTTNSRVWLMRDLEVLEKRHVPVGVRNTAIDGHNQALMEGIRQAILGLKLSAPSGVVPHFAIAAGMITSNLGLHELKHAQAPAGIKELSAKVEKHIFPELPGIPFYFIPGVRSGPSQANLENISRIDIIRGEETEVIGSLRNLAIQGPLLYIHLGSHTKLIKVDSENRIHGGVSTLAGEVLQSVQQQTVLRNSLPETHVSSIDEDFLEEGWSCARKQGLFRSLYLVRVFDLNSNYPKESVYSFFLGALLSEEFRSVEWMMTEDPQEKIILSGLPHLQPAWLHFLKKHPSSSLITLSTQEMEKAFLRGLFEILQSSPRTSLS